MDLDVDLDPRRVVALAMVAIGFGLAARSALTGDPPTAVLWAVVAAVGVVSFRWFADAGPARV